MLIFDSREVRKPDERLLRTLAVIGGQIGQLVRRAHAERALVASERRFRALIEHGHDAIVLYDRGLRMIYRSPTAKGISGYEDRERLGGSLHDLVFEEDRRALQGVVERLMAERGGAAPFRCRILHRSGRLRWIEGVMTNLLDEPAIGALVVNYRDIDEQMRARESLERSERYFRSLIESAGDIIAVADLDWRFTYVNPGITRILGYAAAAGHRPALPRLHAGRRRDAARRGGGRARDTRRHARDADRVAPQRRLDALAGDHHRAQRRREPTCRCTSSTRAT